MQNVAQNLKRERTHIHTTSDASDNDQSPADDNIRNVYDGMSHSGKSKHNRRHGEIRPWNTTQTNDKIGCAIKCQRFPI
ncbi:hypothetical protein THF5H11_20380 [Vibrio jasicida]|nr:hypothetical protein THF5H11_20380 [Vibrio jasicida]CAH1608667.1 hypothetical protein THF5G08_60387 [Vibrio jasicida]